MSQILISKRANIFYLDRVKIMVDDGRVCAFTVNEIGYKDYVNIPDKNTSLLLLGRGSSITNEAARLLSGSNVMVGFSGSGGYPPYVMSELVFMPYYSNHRPTEYMQEWAKMWFDEDKRLEIAKLWMRERINNIEKYWSTNTFINNDIPYDNVLVEHNKNIDNMKTLQELLLLEARLTKKLYHTIAAARLDSSFKRNRRLKKIITVQDKINHRLDHGNYMLYGAASAALHCLGISFSFPILHGVTRNGGLVMDLADVFKDSLILPHGFEQGIINTNDREAKYRKTVITLFNDVGLLDMMFDMVKTSCEQL